MTRDECFQELDALIGAGWGDIPRNKIPADWRDGTPEERLRRRQHQAAMRRNMLRKGLGWHMRMQLLKVTKHRPCFICRSPWKCRHREPELRGIKEPG
jgi:hypothetical protein